MNNPYGTTLGFGLVGFVFLTIFFDAYRLQLMGANPMDTLDSSAIYALVFIFILGRLIFFKSIPTAIRSALRISLSIVMASIIVATLVGCGLIMSGASIAGFARYFFGLAVLSSLSAALWLVRYNGPVLP